MARLARLRLIVDASAMVELLRRTPSGHKAEDAMRKATVLAAPAHMDAEALSALARLARENPDDEPLVAARLRKLTRSPIKRYPCAPLLDRAWRLRANIAIRDALYVALAHQLRAELLTADRRLSRVPTAALGVPIQVVQDETD